ncbi:hypothetical protein EIL82_19345 [Pandoraea apista]|uniref:Uncharacterized protein n=1 Tax=Pandoraea apista TaxID=93218 RepID=A0ABX9ZLJ1_9BURK|nr:hypothetical protein C7830_15995 [Pandoraea apista]RRJ28676.1 hypothetical protein EIB05_18365 [Pandoraea apista]RRJ73669.1 hypothetical protein EIL82_19345 [Pandoraea apista]RSD08193.1 hypothetical protein EJB12_17270 [Pandoraea apista]RSD18085.1 hypothetical protein EIZ52_12920 [Pandoraea apista]
MASRHPGDRRPAHQQKAQWNRFSPVWAATLLEYGGHRPWWNAVYVLVVGCLSAVCTAAMKRTYWDLLRRPEGVGRGGRNGRNVKNGKERSR